MHLFTVVPLLYLCSPPLIIVSLLTIFPCTSSLLLPASILILIYFLIFLLFLLPQLYLYPPSSNDLFPPLCVCSVWSHPCKSSIFWLSFPPPHLIPLSLPSLLIHLSVSALQEAGTSLQRSTRISWGRRRRRITTSLLPTRLAAPRKSCTVCVSGRLPWFLHWRWRRVLHPGGSRGSVSCRGHDGVFYLFYGNFCLKVCVVVVEGAWGRIFLLVDGCWLVVCHDF